MRRLQTLSILFVVLTAIACSNAKVNVSGIKTTLSTATASGANPINADSYGAYAGPTTSNLYTLKVKVSSAAFDPTTATAGGYHISAKVVKW